MPALSADTTAFLDALGGAVGWHRLLEFCEFAAAYPVDPAAEDLAEETQDLLAEMHRLRPPAAVRQFLADLPTNRDAVVAYLEQRS